MGYSPVEPIEYGSDYFKMYQDYDRGPLSAALTDFRRDFVDYHLPSSFEKVIDVGVGAGAFVEATGCRGLDINPHAIVWLKQRGAWGAGPDGYKAMTFWDSFEHIPDHDGYLKSVEWVFMSLPIFAGVFHVLKSKHFKPGEHIWYFTERGLQNYMEDYGFTLVDHNERETDIGREDIHSFAFRRQET